MTHCQIFYPFDNEDGYISVVCHRERFLENLLSLGWQKTAAEAIAVRDELTQKKVVTVLAPNGPMASDEETACAGDNCTASKSNNYSHSVECIAEHEKTIGVNGGQEHEPEAVDEVMEYLSPKNEPGPDEGCGIIPDSEEREFVQEGKSAGTRKKLSLKK